MPYVYSILDNHAKAKKKGRKTKISAYPPQSGKAKKVAKKAY